MEVLGLGYVRPQDIPIQDVARRDWGDRERGLLAPCLIKALGISSGEERLFELLNLRFDFLDDQFGCALLFAQVESFIDQGAEGEDGGF